MRTVLSLIAVLFMVYGLLLFVFGLGVDNMKVTWPNFAVSMAGVCLIAASAIIALLVEILTELKKINKSK